MKSLFVFTGEALCPVYGQYKHGFSACMSIATMGMFGSEGDLHFHFVRKMLG